jgi:hypothetical protein
VSHQREKPEKMRELREVTPQVPALDFSEPTQRMLKAKEKPGFAIILNLEAVNLIQRVRTIAYPGPRHTFEPRFTALRIIDFAGSAGCCADSEFRFVSACAVSTFDLLVSPDRGECGVRKTPWPTTPTYFLIRPRCSCASWERVAAEPSDATSEPAAL